MKGIVYNGTTTELVDGLTLRAPGPREVVVQVAAAGLCHSDISYMSGMYPVPSPGVCGHEAAGVVAEVGNAVTHVQPGDHVIIATLAACGFCQYCMDGRPTACRATLGNWSQPFTLNGDPIYNFAATSAFAEKTLVRDVQCVKIPKDVPLTSAALVGCGVVTGMGAVFNRANVKRGQSALVFGVGGVGLNVIQALKVQGATTIIAVDTVPEKEALARQFGATHFLDGRTADVIAEVSAIMPFTNQCRVGHSMLAELTGHSIVSLILPSLVTHLNASTGKAPLSSSASPVRPQNFRACTRDSPKSIAESLAVAMAPSAHNAISRTSSTCTVVAKCCLTNL